MEPGTCNHVSTLIDRWVGGENECLNELLSLLDSELRRIAHRQMRNERLGHTLQTTALLNEAYIRLVGRCGLVCSHRTQFLALAARLMRNILVDHARAQLRGKRGGGGRVVPLEDDLAFSPARPAEIIRLHDALGALAEFDARKAKVVELRYFGGLTVDEVADFLKLHPNSVIRDWRLARAWLKRALGSAAHGT